MKASLEKHRRAAFDDRRVFTALREPRDKRRSLQCTTPAACIEVDSTLIDIAHVTRHAAQAERRQSLPYSGSDQHTFDEDAGRGNKKV